MSRTTEQTISAIVATITELDELEGFADALRNPSPDHRSVTASDWQVIALRRAELQRGRK